MNNEAAGELLHELKTPLAVIRGFAELLISRDDDETRQTAADQILAAAERLSQSLDTLFGANASPACNKRPASAPPDHRGKRARILVVDDDVFVRRLLRLTLPTEAFEIAEAGDGEIALELLEAQQPDLVILDLHIPSIPGADVLATSKTTRPELPIIVLTADPSQRPSTEQADAFLTKPFSPRELLSLIDQLLLARPQPKAPSRNLPPRTGSA